jgi:hypothetical protein
MITTRLDSEPSATLAAPIFPTFLMTGFECSTFLWKDGRRKDFVVRTAHDRLLADDYDRVVELGFGVVREGIRWPLVAAGRGYDWSSLERVAEASNARGLTIIWDLCHFGLADGFDPFAADAPRRFADYCRAAATRIVQTTSGPRFFTPVNEISFFCGAATDMGWVYPFARGRRQELKRALCRMAIAGAAAIREVDPVARMVHVDPLIYETPAPDHPELSQQVWDDTYVRAFEAWDMLAGRIAPELGGSPEVLDIIGVNVYNFSQAQMNADGSRAVLGASDPRRKPLSEMIRFAWERYRRPVIIGETSGFKETRAEWLRMVMDESLAALNAGVELHGVCLYPFVDIPDWNSGEWAKIGIYDVADDETCGRTPCTPYVEELQRWRDRLARLPVAVPPAATARGRPAAGRAAASRSVGPKRDGPSPIERRA